MLTRRALAGGTAASLLAAPVLARQEAVGEPVTYESGGTTIRAAVYRPAGAGRGAGIAFMHGSGGVGPAYLRLARQFAADGYVVIVPVYYDAAPDDGVRPESVMNAWRQAASDAVEWLIADGLPAERVGLMGYSLGSYVAVDSALGRSRSAAAIGVAGGWSVYVPRPPRRRIPVMILQAERDDHVPSAGTRRWVDHLRDADVPVRLEVIRGARHIMNSDQWDDVFTRSSQFFARNIGRPPG